MRKIIDSIDSGNLCVGRGNDFAFGVGIPHDLDAGCRVLSGNAVRTIDVGKVVGGDYPQGRYFGNGVGIGFDAETRRGRLHPRSPDESRLRDRERRPCRGRHRRQEADDLKAKVLEKAACELAAYPQTLSLWAFRLGQHVCRGVYGYSQAWETLEHAALAAGISESKVARVLYRGLADAVRLDNIEPMPLSVLRGGVH